MLARAATVVGGGPGHLRMESGYQNKKRPVAAASKFGRYFAEKSQIKLLQTSSLWLVNFDNIALRQKLAKFLCPNLPNGYAVARQNPARWDFFLELLILEIWKVAILNVAQNIYDRIV